MFAIPGKQAVTITPKAANQITKLMTSAGHAGLRIGIKKGGCAGMEYTMEYVNEADANDVVTGVQTWLFRSDVPFRHRDRL